MAAFVHKLSRSFQSSDVFRDIATPCGRLLVFANAYNSGFATCWPEGSRDLLNRIEEGASRLGGSESTALTKLLLCSAEAFIEWGKPEKPDALDGDIPVCALTAAFISEDAISILYVGSGALHQRRDGALHRRLKLHTLEEQFKDQGQQAPDNLQTVLVKFLAENSKELDSESWDYRAGDELVIAFPERAPDQELAPSILESLDTPFALRVVVRL